AQSLKLNSRQRRSAYRPKKARKVNSQNLSLVNKKRVACVLMQKPIFPAEVYLQVLEDVEHEIPEQLDEPGSLLYWCLESPVLTATWAERLRRQKLAWDSSAPPLCQVDRRTRAVMLRRLKFFNGVPTVQNFEASGPAESPPAPMAYAAATFYDHRRLVIFSEGHLPLETREFVTSKCQTWESLTFDFDLELGNTISVYDTLNLISLPNLSRMIRSGNNRVRAGPSGFFFVSI
ncbi:hypothetical protein O181_031713, partial [Austropuccinia psidii MF-1]|nr:hypothetical protein [Austropuccinia psidii MF-1]